MLRLAKAHEKQAIAAKLAKMANLDGGAGMSSDMIGGAVKKNRKKHPDLVKFMQSYFTEV